MHGGAARQQDHSSSTPKVYCFHTRLRLQAGKHAMHLGTVLTAAEPRAAPGQLDGDLRCAILANAPDQQASVAAQAQQAVTQHQQLQGWGGRAVRVGATREGSAGCGPATSCMQPVCMRIASRACSHTAPLSTPSPLRTGCNLTCRMSASCPRYSPLRCTRRHSTIVPRTAANVRSPLHASAQMLCFSCSTAGEGNGANVLGQGTKGWRPSKSGTKPGGGSSDARRQATPTCGPTSSSRNLSQL